jgi:hypothetical protein
MKPNIEGGFYLGTESIAKLLGVSRRTINDQFRKGLIIGSFRVGDRYRLSLLDAIKNWPSLAQIGGPLYDFAVSHGLIDEMEVQNKGIKCQTCQTGCYKKI